MRGWVEGSCVWRLSWVSIMGIDFVNLDWQKTASSCRSPMVAPDLKPSLRV